MKTKQAVAINTSNFDKALDTLLNVNSDSTCGYLSFGNSIGMQLKKLPDLYAAEDMVKMQQILFDIKLKASSSPTTQLYGNQFQHDSAILSSNLSERHDSAFTNFHPQNQQLKNPQSHRKHLQSKQNRITYFFHQQNLESLFNCRYHKLLHQDVSSKKIQQLEAHRPVRC